MLQDRSCHQKLVSSSVQKKRLSRQETPNCVKQTQKQKQPGAKNKGRDTTAQSRGSWGHGKINFTQRRSSWAGSRRNYHEKSTSILGPDATKPQKTRELPGKINIEEVDPPKKPKWYEFYCENPVQEHPRTTKSTRIIKVPRKMHIEEVEEPKKYGNYTRNPFRTLSRAPQTHEKYENYHDSHTKRTCKHEST